MVKIYWRSFVYIFLVCECVCFLVVYYAGTDGILTMWSARQINEDKERALCMLKNEVDDLKKQLHQWDSDIFYKEKVAREQLQMARSGDTIYYLMETAQLLR